MQRSGRKPGRIATTDALAKGAHVKITVRFRGPELRRPDLGHELLDTVQEDLSEFAKVETRSRQLEGRQLTMVLAPDCWPPDTSTGVRRPFFRTTCLYSRTLSEQTVRRARHGECASLVSRYSA